MKISLVEPLDNMKCEDRPNLGCAMLVANCENQGLSTRLIHGQTYYIKQMFMENSKESWELLQYSIKKGLFQGDGKDVNQEPHPVFSLPQKEFQRKLFLLYKKNVISKNPRDHLNPELISEFVKTHHYIRAAYNKAFKEGREDFSLVDQYVNIVIESKPDLIGFSIFKGFNAFSRLIRKKLKARLPSIPIVIGGPFTPFIERDKLEGLFSKEHFDYIIIGAGDHALPRLAKAVQGKLKPDCIHNLCYLEKGRVVINKRSPVGNVEDLPFPAFDQFQLDSYLAPYRILPLQSSRGCSYRKCAFCTHHRIYGNEYKTISCDRVADTLAYLKDRYQCNYFAFHDEELPPTRVRGICQAIKTKKIENIHLYGIARLVKGFADEALLKLMRNAGFRAMEWGLESGSQRVIDLIGKGSNVDVAREILRKCHKQGISNLCFVFFGFPGETKEEAQETVNFLQKNAEFIAINMAGVFNLNKHSPIWSMREKYGVEISDDGKYSVRKGLGKDEAKAFLKKFRNEVKLNNTRVASSLFRNTFIPYFPMRMQIFLLSSHGVLPKEKAVKCIKEGGGAALFPLFLGEVKKNGKEIIFFPVDMAESVLVSSLCPLESIKVSRFQDELIRLSDGTRNIKEIIGESRKKLGLKGRHINKESLEFFNRFFSQNFGLAFRKRWEIL